ncbi:MAG: MC/SLC25 family protein [archaeon]|nr:MC/SLC25 family protein [archaeon]
MVASSSESRPQTSTGVSSRGYEGLTEAREEEEEEEVTVETQMGPPSSSLLHVVQDLTAGTFGGVLQVIAGHPLDTVKVRLQTQAAALPSGSSPVYSGMMHCIRSMWKDEGLRGFYKGMSSPLFGMAFLNALLFATYAESSKYFLRKNQGAPLTLGQQTMAGSLAGLVQCIIVGPTELVKARLQVQARSCPSKAGVFFEGPLDCIRKTHAHQGIRGLFAGMAGTVYREIPAYALMFASYEGIKDLLIPTPDRSKMENEIIKNGVIDHDFSSMYPGRLIVAGGVAGVLCWTISYPQDVVLNRLRVQQIDSPPIYRKHPLLFDGGFIDCGMKLIRTEGWRTLFRGYTACLVRAFPANAASFLGYEMVKSLWKV